MKVRWFNIPNKQKPGRLFIESDSKNKLTYHVSMILSNNIIEGYRLVREDGNSWYEVRKKNYSTTCSCPAFKLNTKTCKHIRAINTLYTRGK
jgi:hypothetical protein